MENRVLKIKLSLLYFIVCGAMACYYPFLAVYFQDRGLKYSQIGFLFAVNSLVAVVCQPIWGIITDKYLKKRRSLIAALLLSSIFIFCYAISKNFYPILFAVIIFMVFQSPISSINDAYCYEIIDSNKGLQYGKVRLMGSIGYAVVALIMAPVIKLMGINISYFAYAAINLLAIFILRNLKFKSRGAKSTIDLGDVASILKDNRFVMLAISAAIINASMGANGNYLAVLIEKTGGDVSKLGILWFIVAMSEVPALFLANRILKKFGILNVYIAGLSLYTVRFFLDSFSPSYQMVLVLQVMQSVTFTFYLMSTLQYINSIIPQRARTTALTIFGSFAGGVGGFVGNIAGGYVLQNLDVFYLYRLMSGVCIAALVIALILKKLDVNMKINKTVSEAI